MCTSSRVIPVSVVPSAGQSTDWFVKNNASYQPLSRPYCHRRQVAMYAMYQDCRYQINGVTFIYELTCLLLCSILLNVLSSCSLSVFCLSFFILILPYLPAESPPGIHYVIVTAWMFHLLLLQANPVDASVPNDDEDFLIVFIWRHPASPYHV